MIARFIAVATTAGVFATAACADEDPAASLPEWGADVEQALVAEDGTPRSEEQIRENWSKMTLEQQDQVRSTCRDIQASSGGVAPSEPVAGRETITGTTLGGALEDGTQDGASASERMAQMSRVCATVEAL